jgi:hypothetical protein
VLSVATVIPDAVVTTESFRVDDDDNGDVDDVDEDGKEEDEMPLGVVDDEDVDDDSPDVDPDCFLGRER